MRTTKSESDIYIEKTFVKETEERLNLIEKFKSHQKFGIQVSPGEGIILKLLCSSVKAKKVVELGTLFGYSTSWFLESVGQHGYVYSFEKEKEHFDFASENLKKHILNQNLKIYLGDALDQLSKIESLGPFDVIFIDANKSGYMDYLKWADKNLRSGGLILADNSYLWGEVFKDEPPQNNKNAWKAMREVNAFLGSSSNYISAMIPTAEGLTVGLKK